MGCPVWVGCLWTSLMNHTASLRTNSLWKTCINSLRNRVLNAPNTDPFHTGNAMFMRVEHLEEIGNPKDPKAPAHDIVPAQVEKKKKSTSAKKYLQLLSEDLPLRLFSIAWLLFCFFFITYLAAEIQSRATVRKLRRRVQSLRDVTEVSYPKKVIKACCLTVRKVKVVKLAINCQTN